MGKLTQINLVTMRLLMVCLMCLFGVLALASPDSLAIVEISSQLEEAQNRLDSLEVDIAKFEELASDLEVVQSWRKNPVNLLKNISIYLVIVIVSLIALWRLFVWLEPKWYVKLIQRLIERYEEVNLLKRRKNILVLMPEDANNSDFIDSFFSDKEFSQVKKVSISKYEKPASKVDIYFANNENSSLPQEVLMKYLEEDEYACLFYFGRPGTWDFKLSNRLNSRLNLANSRAQVYGNLISTLKYHDLITPKIKL